MSPRALVLALLLPGSLVSCRPKGATPTSLSASDTPPPSRSVELSPLGLTGETGLPPPFLVESSSAVVPPGASHPHCPGGRAVLATSDYRRGRSEILYLSRDLECVEGPSCWRTQSKEFAGTPGLMRAGVYPRQRSENVDATGRCLQANDPAGHTLEPSHPASFGGTDQIVLWTGGAGKGTEGRLVHLWMGAGAYAPLYPNVDSYRWTPGRPAPTPSCRSPLIRHGLYVRFSDDCGDTWSEPTFINLPAMSTAAGPLYVFERVENGVYVPRGPGLSWGNDRPELFADPVDPVTPLYISVDATMADGRYDMLLRSDDGGVHWRTAYNYPDFAGGPKVMTSTRDRLYVARCLGRYGDDGRVTSYPELSWFDRQGTRLLGRAWVPFERDGHPVPCCRPEPELLDGAPGGLGDLSISRGPDGDDEHDSVRVVYGSARPGESQSAYVSAVHVDRGRECTRHPERCVHVDSASLIDPPPGMSTFHINVIDPTPAAGAPLLSSLVQMQLWSRVPGHTVTPARAWLTEHHRLENFVPLGPSWRPALGSIHFVGDYTYGSFFWTPSASGKPRGHFFTLWPSSLDILEPNLFLRHRIVNVSMLTGLP